MANGSQRPFISWPIPVTVLGLAVLLALVVLACGAEPREAFAQMFRGAVGGKAAWGQTLARTAVLTFSGLAIALSFRAGLFNIGAEGQFLAGAIAAGAAAAKLLPADLPSLAAIPALLTFGAFFGALWSLLAGTLKVWRGVNEVIGTLMLNLIAVVALRFSVSYGELLRDPGTIEAKGALLPAAAQLPGWGGTSFHSGVFLILPAVLLLYAVLYHTRTGLSVRAAGLNPIAARAVGMPVQRVRLLVFGASGALAGFGGAMAMMADGRLNAELYPQYGYMAIAVALIAGLHPLGVLPGALAFAMLESGAKAMERNSGVPSQVVFLVEGLVILALLSRSIRLPGSQAAQGAEAA